MVPVGSRSRPLTPGRTARWRPRRSQEFTARCADLRSPSTASELRHGEAQRKKLTAQLTHDWYRKRAYDHSRADCTGVLRILAGWHRWIADRLRRRHHHLITPLLTLLLGVDIHYAIGAALVSVIATSSGAAAACVKEGFSNIRIGMFMEIATTTGAVLGGSLALHIPTSAIAVIFGLILLYSAAMSLRSHDAGDAVDNPDALAQTLELDSNYPTSAGLKGYHVHHVVTGSTVMFGAGILSGLLGIGSGALKVIALDEAMRIPFKVSTTTSNFMIGVTAAASVGLYLKHGYIDPGWGCRLCWACSREPSWERGFCQG